MQRTRYILGPFLLSLLLSAAMLGCGGDSAEDMPGGENGDGEGSGEQRGNSLDPQVPPADAMQMSAWLARWKSEGWEDEWVCEDAPTAKTQGADAIHVHNDANGKNRVCNNQRLADAPPGKPVPEGSAALKFVGENIYVEVKTAPESAEGNNWYWYAPGGSPQGKGIEACRACHSAAGADADHPGLGDYVYFQVQ